MDTSTDTGTLRTGSDALRDLMERHERSSAWLAKRLDCSQPHAWKLIVGKRGITPDTAIKLGAIFDVDPTLFLSAQEVA